MTCSFSPCVPPSQTACTSCATLALCVLNSSVHFSPSRVQHLHWYVLCDALSRVPLRFLGLFLVSALCCSPTPSGPQVFSIKVKKPSPNVHSVLEPSPSSNYFNELMSSRKCFAHAVEQLASFPLARCAGIWLNNCHQHLWVGQVVLLNLLCNSLGLAQTSNSKFPCNWPTQWECMLPVSSFSGKAHEHSSALCGCFEDIALRFEVHLRFPELAQHAPRVPGCIDSCFPLLWRRTRSRSGLSPSILPLSSRLLPESTAVPLAPSPFAQTLIHLSRHNDILLSLQVLCNAHRPHCLVDLFVLQRCLRQNRRNTICNSDLRLPRQALTATVWRAAISFLARSVLAFLWVVNILAHQDHVSHSTPPLGQVLLPPGSAFVGMPGGVPSASSMPMPAHGSSFLSTCNRVPLLLQLFRLFCFCQLLRLRGCTLQFSHSSHSARQGQHSEVACCRRLPPFRFKLRLPADGTQNHPQILLFRVMCSVL